MLKQLPFILFIIFFFAAIGINPLCAQNLLYKSAMKDTSGALLYFTSLPESFKSELSPDKKKIRIIIKNSEASDSARRVNGKGLITDVYVQKFGSELEISVMLKDKAGYTVIALPYSRTLFIEAFKWDKLNPAEDNYRSGLLALEDKIDKSAEKFLSISAAGGNADASASLGLINIKRGRLLEAAGNFSKAISLSTRIIDAYAGFTQILTIAGLFEQSKRFEEVFKKESGLASYQDIVLPDSINTQSLTPALIASIDSIAKATPIRIDSGKTADNKDTLNDRFSVLFQKSDTLSRNSSIDKFPSLLPEWFTGAAIIITLLFIAVVIILGYSYYKWRKKQLNKIATNAKTGKFSENLKSAEKIIAQSPKIVTDKYRQAGNLVDRVIDNNKSNADNTLNRVEAPAEENKDKEVQNKLFEILSKVSEKELSPGLETKAEEIRPEPIPPEESRPVSAKIELAMHLQQEQQKLKQKNIDTLQQGNLPADQKKLYEVAKKLGIEKGSVEIKRVLENMQKDKKALNELAEKFHVPKK